MPSRSTTRKSRICMNSFEIQRLAQGGTAVGTGLNAPADFSAEFARALNEIIGNDSDFEPAKNAFEALGFR